MKRIPIKKFLLVLLGVWLTGISGCGENQVKVIITPRAVTIPRDQQFQFTVEVTDTQDTSVTWCVLDTTGACVASTDLSRGTINPTTGLYTPPATIPTPNTITIRVASNADPSVTDAVVATIVSGNELRFGANTKITDYTNPAGTCTPGTNCIATTGGALTPPLLSSGQHSVKIFHNTNGSLDNTFIYTVWSDNRNSTITTTKYDVFFRQITITVDTSKSPPTESTNLSDTIQISTGTSGSSVDPADPSLAVDSSGNVYVAWSSGTTSNHDIYVVKHTFSTTTTTTSTTTTTTMTTSTTPTTTSTTTSTTTTTFETPVRFDNDPGACDQRAPSIATDGTNIYVAWQDNRITGSVSCGTYAIRAAVGSPTASTPPTSFAIPLTNTTTPENQTEPSVALVGNNIYIAWTDAQSVNNDIYFTKGPLPATSSSWSGPFRVNDDKDTLCYIASDGTPTGNCYSNVTPPAQQSPSLTVDTAGNIYVAWEDNRDPLNPSTTKADFDIYFAKSSNISGGASFDAATVVYISGTDTLTEHNIRVNDDTTTNGFLDNADQARPSIAVEKPETNATTTTPDKVYIAWQDKRACSPPCNDSDIFVAKSLDGGNSFWINSQVNHDATTKPQYYPSLALDTTPGILPDGRAYLIWTDERNNTGGSASDVFFAIGE